MIKDAVRKIIEADSEITDALATYQFADGAALKPAVFVTPEFPEDIKYPAILIDIVSGSSWGCRGNRGADTLVDVSVYDQKRFNNEALEALAENIWKALDRANIDAYLLTEGYECWGCQAAYPRMNNDEDGYPGFVISVRMTITEVD